LSIDNAKSLRTDLNGSGRLRLGMNRWQGDVSGDKTAKQAGGEGERNI